ncbi:MAG: type IV pili methyl-accepting chemotaxis transducer N-terminal domain-containing protein [gamma proteobacterium symbiont of Bathyaustriella thionipta]|nr:type IV pili methyl-accepting chemotaxis transducer N-terminal domain-containing protein [gamma proteobacterium symbiont of Bathyaustriella thionipta]
MPVKNIPSYLILVLLLMAGSVNSTFATSGLSMGEALDMAGRQRMLTQRMIKSYALLGQHLNAGARTELIDSIALFDDELQQIRSIAKSPAEQTQRLCTKVHRLLGLD